MKHWPLAVLGLADLVEGINEIGHAAYRIGLRRVHRAGVPGDLGRQHRVRRHRQDPAGRGPRSHAARRRRPAGDPHPRLRAAGEAAGAGRGAGRARRGSGSATSRRCSPARFPRCRSWWTPTGCVARRRRSGKRPPRTSSSTTGFSTGASRRDLDIVVVEASDPFGAKAPRREHPDALGRADAIVLSRAANLTEARAAMAVLGAYAPDGDLHRDRRSRRARCGATACASAPTRCAT